MLYLAAFALSLGGSLMVSSTDDLGTCTGNTCSDKEEEEVFNALQQPAARHQQSLEPLKPPSAPCDASPIKPVYLHTTTSCGQLKKRLAPVSKPMKDYYESFAVARSERGILDISMIVDTKVLEFPEHGIRVTTRLYNGSFPGPVIHVKRGDLVKVKLVNNLAPNNFESPPMPIRMREGWEGVKPGTERYDDVGQDPKDPGEKFVPHVDNFRMINDTNFHTHGWHVSPQASHEYDQQGNSGKVQDYVLPSVAAAGGHLQYAYKLSAYHSGGAGWYHPHMHGSTAVQTGAGMAGPLIVEDSKGQVPEWIEKLDDHLILITEQAFQYVGNDAAKMAPGDPYRGCYSEYVNGSWGTGFSSTCELQHRTALIAQYSGDKLFKIEELPGFGCGEDETPPLRHWFAVNGDYAPYLSIKTGEWHRLRFIHTGISQMLSLMMDSPDCELHLIGKDNAYLPRFPRKLKKGIYLSLGGRAQVLVRCSKPGQKAFHNVQPVEAEPDAAGCTMHEHSGCIDPASNQTVLYLHVTGDPIESPLEEPAVETSKFPRYLQNMVDLPMDQIATPSVKNPYRPDFITDHLLAEDGKTFMFRQTYDFPNGPPGIPPVDYVVNGEKKHNNASGPDWVVADIAAPVRFTMNNQSFQEPQDAVPPSLDPAFQAILQSGKVYQFNITGQDIHSAHIHTNPTQFVSFGRADYLEFWGGFFEVGDWQDTFALPNAADASCLGLDGPGECLHNSSAIVRHMTDCYTGPLVAHCHILYHEDLGMFTLLYIGGEDLTPANFPNDGIFKEPPQQCTEANNMCPPPQCADYTYAK